MQVQGSPYRTTTGPTESRAIVTTGTLTWTRTATTAINLASFLGGHITTIGSNSKTNEGA